jgi:hypothetical protein
MMSGCSAGAMRQHAYHLGSPQVLQRGSLVLALAVQDQRSYVLSGAKRSTFVGLSRGGWGIAFDVTTVSGQAMWADFATSIRRGLEKAGYGVKTAYVGDRASLAQVRMELLRTGAQRGLAVQIQEWKSETYNDIGLRYRVALEVFDAVGQEIGRTAIKGSEVFGGNLIDPDGHIQRVLADAHSRKLEELLNAPAIRRALSPVPAALPEPPPAEPLPPAPTPATRSRDVERSYLNE